MFVRLVERVLSDGGNLAKFVGAGGVGCGGRCRGGSAAICGLSQIYGNNGQISLLYELSEYGFESLLADR
jgi:hypothetical protein